MIESTKYVKECYPLRNKYYWLIAYNIIKSNKKASAIGGGSENCHGLSLLCQGLIGEDSSQYLEAAPP